MEQLKKELTQLFNISKDDIVKINSPDEFDESIKNGYLTHILDKWYFLHQPAGQGTTVIWQANYYNFLSQYLKEHLGTNYILSPEHSLDLLLNENEIKNQIIVQTAKNLTNYVNTSNQKYSFVICYGHKNIPNLKKNIVNGLQTYSLESALLNVNPTYFKNRALEAEMALKLVKQPENFFENELNKNSKRLGKIIGAYRSIGMVDMAQQILDIAKEQKINSVISNPFENNYESQLSLMQIDNPTVARIEQKWRMYNEEIEKILPQYSINQDLDSLVVAIQNEFLNDADNSLSIEGYKITPQIINSLKTNKGYEKNKDALAAKGYREAFTYNLEMIKKNFLKDSIDYLNIANAIKRNLFKPAVEAKLLTLASTMGYRDHPVFIKNAIHVPVNFKNLNPCMSAFDGLLKETKNPISKAILAHLFLVYIHPYPDGNGRTARFLMNNILSSAGLPWVIIPKEKRTEYFNNLEKACSGNDILPFANFVMEHLKLQPKLNINKPKL